MTEVLASKSRYGTALGRQDTGDRRSSDVPKFFWYAPRVKPYPRRSPALAEKPEIAVIGGGVVGLTTGIEGLRQGYEVTLYEAEPYNAVLAQHPEQGDPVSRRTSEVGIAQWLPDFETEHPTDKQKERTRWMHWALNGYLSRITAEGYQDAMRKRNNIELMKQPSPMPSFLRAALERIGPATEFGEIPDNPLHFTHGYNFTTLSFNTPAMLNAMRTEFADRGGEFVQRKVGSLDELHDLDQEVIVNSMGLGARELFPQLGLRAVKGHVVFLDNPGIDTVVSAEDLHLHPRGRNRLALGALYLPEGTYTTEEPTQEEHEDIRHRVGQMVDTDIPTLQGVKEKLAEAQYVGEIAGFRPSRDGGPIVEAQELGDKLVVHNTGHGGEGWSLAFGTAKAAVEKIAEKGV